MNIEILRSRQTVALPAGDERHIKLIGIGIGFRWRGAAVLWQRPLAVEIDGQGETQRVPIPDVTRAVFLALFLGGVILMGLSWLTHHLGKRNREEIRGNT